MGQRQSNGDDATHRLRDNVAAIGHGSGRTNH
jgi:hypothetical protein